jgi:3'-phosphoadenosine 5'-phosphosulfate (PAPS) 3'-phosphatase
MEEYLEFAKRIAYHAGDVMKEYFYKDQGVEYKEDRTPVTVADKMINEYLIEEVKKT